MGAMLPGCRSAKGGRAGCGGPWLARKGLKSASASKPASQSEPAPPPPAAWPTGVGAWAGWLAGPLVASSCHSASWLKSKLGSEKLTDSLCAGRCCCGRPAQQPESREEH